VDDVFTKLLNFLEKFLSQHIQTFIFGSVQHWKTSEQDIVVLKVTTCSVCW